MRAAIVVMAVLAGGCSAYSTLGDDYNTVNAGLESLLRVYVDVCLEYYPGDGAGFDNGAFDCVMDNLEITIIENGSRDTLLEQIALHTLEICNRYWLDDLDGTGPYWTDTGFQIDSCIYANMTAATIAITH